MKFYMNEFNQKQTYELLQMILNSEFLLEEPPTIYIQSNHIQMLADIGSAFKAIMHNAKEGGFQVHSFKNAGDNGLYIGLGSEKQRGAQQFFDKIAQDLENFIRILVNNKNEFTVEDESQKQFKLVKVLKDLMSNLYEDYNFDQQESKQPKESKKSEESKGSNFITYMTKNSQLCFVFANEKERDDKAGAIGSWNLLDSDKNKLKNKDILKENKTLLQPATYTNNKTSFYLTLCEGYEELFISFGKDPLNKRREDFISLLDLKQDPPSEYNKTLNRVQYCDGLFTVYNHLGGIYITKYAKFFQENNINLINNTYYRVSKGEVKEVQRITQDEINKRKMKADTSQYRQLSAAIMKRVLKQDQSDLKIPSSSSSSNSSIASNQAGFINSLNPAPLQEIKFDKPLTLTGDFTEAGVGITFPRSYNDLFLKVFQGENVLIVEEDSDSLRLFLSAENCQSGLFGRVLKLFEFGEQASDMPFNLNLDVIKLTMPDKILNEILKDNQPIKKQAFRVSTAQSCTDMFQFLMKLAKLNRIQVLSYTAQNNSSLRIS